MNELYELKEKLMKELEEHGAKDLSAGSLEIVDKLAHTVKNLCKIIEDMEDEGYSSYGYARGRGRQRDSRGRYSSNGYSMARRLRDMSYDAPDEQTRHEMERLASRVEQM